MCVHARLCACCVHVRTQLGWPLILPYFLFFFRFSALGRKKKKGHFHKFQLADPPIYSVLKINNLCLPASKVCIDLSKILSVSLSGK